MGHEARASRRTGRPDPAGRAVPADGEEVVGPRVPERTCVGCGKRVPQAECARFVLGPPAGEGRGAQVAFDAATSTAGRGLWVERSRACLERACRQGFSKAARQRVDADVEVLVGEIEAALARRLEGLLAGGKRAGQLALGGDAVMEAIHGGRVALVVVAVDAGGIAQSDEVTSLAGKGRAIAYKTKAELGAIVDRTEIALVAVLHEGLAVEVKRAREVAAAYTGSGSQGWRSEVR